MATDYELDAVIRFSTEGQPQIRSAVTNLQTDLYRLRKEGKLTEDAFQSLTKATTQTGRSMEQGLARQAAKASLAVKDVGRSQDEANNSLIRARYALYDVSTTYAAVSAAALAAVAATTTFAVKYESAFSAVERTTLQASGAVSQNIGSIRQDLYDLSTQIPIAFDELSRIASLGAQLGVPDTQLAKFTDTVAKFAATTNISIDEAALAFGQLDSLLDDVDPTNYENLGSAIALVGVNSAATESQIVSIARELAPAASAAGFTADQVIGLSGALGSLKVPPERSRSTLLQFFETLNGAVAEGGTKLDQFASVVGVTSDQLTQMVKNGQGLDVLQRFITTMAGGDTVEVTQALEALGLAGLRTNPTIRALAQNTGLLTQAMADARQGFSQGTFLDQAFAKVLEDAASQLQLLANSFTNFMSVAGIPFLNFLKVVLPPAIELLKFLTEFAQSPFGQAILGWVGGLTLIVGLFTAYRAAAALATASSYALTTAFGTSTGAAVTLRGGVTGLMASLLGLSTAAGTTATRVEILRAGLIALGKATVVLAVIQGITMLITDFGGSMQWVTGIVYDLLSALGQVSAGVRDFARGWANALDGIVQGLGGPLNSILDGAEQFDAGIIGWAKDAKVWAAGLTSAGSAASGASKFFTDAGLAALSGSVGAGEFAGSLNDLGGAAGGAAKEVRTLVDYANDLVGLFSRSFDIRFKSQLAMDDVANSWQTLTDRVTNARIELQKLTADRTIKEYFLGIANQYGDTLRAGELSAELAEINQKIADTQADATAELNGNTKGARQNRKAITDILSQYENYISALAESGADQTTLNNAVSQSRAAFISQAQALGYSDAELQPYILHFNDLATAIARIPRNVTVTPNLDPALQALNEFVSKASAAGASAGAGFASGMQQGLAKTARGIELQNKIADLQAQLAQAVASGNISGARYYGQAITQYAQQLKAGNYATGGFTGRGGKHEPAGVVHRGEYVVPKEQVNQRTGLPYASALGQLQRGTRPAPSGGYARGGFVTGDGMIVDLSATSVSALNRPVYLVVDGKVLATTVNGSNERQALRGSN